MHLVYASLRQVVLDKTISPTCRYENIRKWGFSGFAKLVTRTHLNDEGLSSRLYRLHGSMARICRGRQLKVLSPDVEQVAGKNNGTA